MKAALKLYIGILCAFVLTACFGENYDFSPPTVLVIDPSSLEDEELAETNIYWDSDDFYDKALGVYQVVKKTILNAFIAGRENTIDQTY